MDLAAKSAIWARYLTQEASITLGCTQWRFLTVPQFVAIGNRLGGSVASAMQLKTNELSLDALCMLTTMLFANVHYTRSTKFCCCCC